MDRNASNRKQNTSQESSNSNSRPLSIESPRTLSNANQIERLQQQLRQPENMQGLLRFAMEATKAEDAPHDSRFQPLDEEKKKFFEEALSSVTVNIIEELKKDLKLLQTVIDMREEDDPSDYEAALDRIADWADRTDVANDFYKMNGFSVLKGCLNSPHSGIRWRCANLIAELTQNNPVCQNGILNEGLLPILLSMVDSDPSDTGKIKALYAISCIVRGHENALKHMEQYDGYSVLIRAIQSPLEKLEIKSAFLLSSLCTRDNVDNLKLTLIKMGLIKQAAGLLSLRNLLPETQEQLLSMLNGLTNNNYLPALQECRRPELCLKQTLERHWQESKKDGNIDKESICKELLDKIFADQDTEQDR